MKTLKFVAIVGALSFVAACTTDLDKSRTVEPTGGTPFTQALTKEYKDLAAFEADEMYDWRDAGFYARKALAAANGEQVGPQDPAVVGVRGALDQPGGLQLADDLHHRLRPHERPPRQLRVAQPRPQPQHRQRRVLRQRQPVLGHPLLDRERQRAVQPSDDVADPRLRLARHARQSA